MKNLYSKEYIKQMKELHKKSKTFGRGVAIEFDIIKKLIENYDINSILDYGCGKGTLVKVLKENYPDFKIQGYDPGISKFSKLPNPSDLVTSTDVMEHIEPDCIDAVFDHLKKMILKVGYFEIACLPAGRILPDGRNAHLITESPEWWKEKFLNRWRESEVKEYIVENSLLHNKPERIFVTIVIGK